MRFLRERWKADASDTAQLRYKRLFLYYEMFANPSEALAFDSVLTSNFPLLFRHFGEERNDSWKQEQLRALSGDNILS